MRIPHSFLFGLAALGLALILAGCSSTATLTSAPRTTPVVIDGSNADWEGALKSVEGLSGITMGVRNDGQDLYLALTVADEALVRQIATQGLTVWFDAEGGKEKRVGVQFPLGMQPGVRQGRGELPMPSFDHLALRYGEDAPGTRRPAVGADGVEASASLETETLVVELRVPLQAVGPSGEGFAVGAAPGTEVGVGLETSEVERPAMRRPVGGRAGRGGPPAGGFPGGGGPRGGPPGGRGSDIERPEPLNDWVRVTLADP